MMDFVLMKYHFECIRNIELIQTDITL